MTIRHINASVHSVGLNERTDARRPVLRPWIRSAEVRGKRRYENWYTTTCLVNYKYGLTQQAHDVVMMSMRHRTNAITTLFGRHVPFTKSLHSVNYRQFRLI